MICRHNHAPYLIEGHCEECARIDGEPKSSLSVRHDAEAHAFRVSLRMTPVFVSRLLIVVSGLAAASASWTLYDPKILLVWFGIVLLAMRWRAVRSRIIKRCPSCDSVLFEHAHYTEIFDGKVLRCGTCFLYRIEADGYMWREAQDKNLMRAWFEIDKIFFLDVHEDAPPIKWPKLKIERTHRGRVVEAGWTGPQGGQPKGRPIRPRPDVTPPAQPPLGQGPGQLHGALWRLDSIQEQRCPTSGACGLSTDVCKCCPVVVLGEVRGCEALFRGEIWWVEGAPRKRMFDGKLKVHFEDIAFGTEIRERTQPQVEAEIHRLADRVRDEIERRAFLQREKIVFLPPPNILGDFV